VEVPNKVEVITWGPGARTENQRKKADITGEEKDRAILTRKIHQKSLQEKS